MTARTSPPAAPITLEELQTHGVTDPQIRIYDDKAYLYASHDINPASTEFVMPDWQLWTSEDLVRWRYESTLAPSQTHIGKPFNGCWAGDAICKNGTYYWCFSVVDQENGLHEIGLVSGPTPEGPWSDPIGGPWIAADAADTHVYDPGFLQLASGELYLVFGAWNYYIAKVADDMSGLAEPPSKVEILSPAGPYGEGKTDDKPFLHQRGDLFYLSWGCFYATSRTPYGPYQYRGSIVAEEKMDDFFLKNTWPNGPQQGRHGSFFDWKGQSYFMYCDMSFSGNRYYRGSWISYVHYRQEGAIAPIEISADAVGRYSAGTKISAAHYSSATSIQKVECDDGSFSIAPLAADAAVTFPNIRGIDGPCADITLTFSRVPERPCPLQISNGEKGKGQRVAVASNTVRLSLTPFDARLGLTIRFPEANGTALLIASIEVTCQ